MQKTKHFALGGIFTAIVLFLFQSFYTPSSNATDNRLGGTEPNAGGQSISVNDAKRLIKSFQEANPDFKGRQGFFIGKSAVEALFNADLNANGIILCPTLNDEGEISMVISATYATDARVTPNNTGVYLAQTFCPNVCGVFAQ